MSLETGERCISMMSGSYLRNSNHRPSRERFLTIDIQQGDCLDILRGMDSGIAQLILTSPPYNVGKEYEVRRSMTDYVEEQKCVIEQCSRVLKPGGSLCWQIGNHISNGEVVPLDAVLYPAIKSSGLALRNRIIWTFGHGLHAKNRFSGRHESILWATKGNDYYFNLDAVRTPQKYPGKKHYKGVKAGQLSGNPLGANPGDVWSIPNVKHNHPEKTDHPCQFPQEIVRRLVLATTVPGDLVVDPYSGSGTTGVVCDALGRHATLVEIEPRYVAIARDRILNAGGMFSSLRGAST